MIFESKYMEIKENKIPTYSDCDKDSMILQMPMPPNCYNTETILKNCKRNE